MWPLLPRAAGRHKSGLSREEENTRQKLYKLRDEAEALEGEAALAGCVHVSGMHASWKENCLLGPEAHAAGGLLGTTCQILCQ